MTAKSTSARVPDHSGTKLVNAMEIEDKYWNDELYEKFAQHSDLPNPKTVDRECGPLKHEIAEHVSQAAYHLSHAQTLRELEIAHEHVTQD